MHLRSGESTDAGRGGRSHSPAGSARDAGSGLANAIARTSRQLTEANGVRLKLDLARGRRDLDPDVEYNLLRIAQEAVMNAVNHAGARTVRVSLDYPQGTVNLSVADDGSGFEEHDVPPSGHYGIIGMRERAAQIGARFNLSSSPGRGTTISVLLGT